MKTRVVLDLFLIVLLLSACGSKTGTSASVTPTPTAVSGTHATVVDLVNLVDAHPNLPDPWKPAEVGMAIFPGGEVWAREASTARLGLGDSLVRVAPNTIFTLSRTDDQTLQLNLNEGQVWLNVEGLEAGEQFQVETPGATASVRGTRFSVSVKEDQTSVVSVIEGEVSFKNAAGEKVVGPGQESSAKPGEAPSDPLPMSREQQLLWGNALGPGLDAALPYTGESLCPQQFQGTLVSDAYFDPQNLTVSYDQYDASNPGVDSSFTTINLQDCTIADPPGFLSGSIYDFSYNPIAGKVLFTRYDGSHKICISDPDGQNLNCFDTGENRTDLYYGYPAWSSNGSKIIFYAEYYNEKQSALYSANPDGSGLTRLTSPDTGYYTHGIFSPDGTHVAYLRATGYTDIKDTYGKEDNELWIADAGGGNPVQLSNTIFGLPYLIWSPDGTWIALGMAKTINLYNPAGGTQSIANAGNSIYNLQWSPSTTGWPLIYTAADPDTKARALYIVGGPDQPPTLLASDIHSGPYLSTDGKYAMLSQRTVLDADKSIYNTEVFFITLHPAFWP